MNRLTKYNNCDILKNQNDVEQYGFNKDNTLGQMIDLAILHRCPIIIKSGINGKWYLKGKNRELEWLRIKINENINMHRNGVDCYLIE
jgi:hypothetical protein